MPICEGWRLNSVCLKCITVYKTLLVLGNALYRHIMCVLDGTSNVSVGSTITQQAQYSFLDVWYRA